MCRDQIVAFGGRVPCRNFGANELHAIERQRRAEQAFSGDLEHPGTGIHTGHLGRGVALQERCQKFPMAFADQEGVLEEQVSRPKTRCGTSPVCRPRAAFPSSRSVWRDDRIAPSERAARRPSPGRPGLYGSTTPRRRGRPGHTQQRQANHRRPREISTVPTIQRRSTKPGDARKFPTPSAGGRGCAVRAALKPEDERQRGGDEKHIIEMIVKKRPRANGFNQPAIGRIEEASRQTQRVERVTERLHRRAVITRPAPIARSTFRLNTIMVRK